MAKHRKSSGLGGALVTPAPSSSEREVLDASVTSLSGLNVDQLRLQWRNHLGGIAPAHLPGWLLMRVLAYRIQAVAFGDLDRAVLRRLPSCALVSLTLMVQPFLSSRRLGRSEPLTGTSPGSAEAEGAVGSPAPHARRV